MDAEARAKVAAIFSQITHVPINPQIAALLARLGADRHAMDKLVRARYIDRVLDDAQFLEKREPVLQRISATRVKLAGLVAAEPSVGAREAWDMATLGQRRALLETLIDRVNVRRSAYRGEPVADRLEIVLE